MRSGKWTNWTSIDPHLGTDTDKNIGKRFSIPRGTIAYRRNLLGIQRYSPKKVVNWGLIDIELGKASDVEIARKHGINSATISKRRKSLGIPQYVKPDANFDWSRVDWSMSNKAIARLFKGKGMGDNRRIASKRKELGIPPHPKTTSVMTSSIFEELGTIPDELLAKRHSVGSATIGRWRNALGIPRSAELVRHDWSMFDQYWGKASDMEISRITGIPRATIATHRARKGIPRYRKE